MSLIGRRRRASPLRRSVLVVAPPGSSLRRGCGQGIAGDALALDDGRLLTRGRGAL